MRYIHDTSSRFRILKGGRISLVVSALLTSSAVVGTGLYAQDVVTGAQTTPQQYDDIANPPGTNIDLLVSTGSIVVQNTGAQTAVDIVRDYASPYTTTITNNNTISAESTDGGNATAISIKGDSSANGHTTGDISITNTGAISATGMGLSEGVYIANHDSVMHILNDTAGTITSSTWGVYFKDSQLLSGSTITNNGLISVNSSGPGAGLLFNNGSANMYESSIINNGTIAVNADSTAYGMNLQYFKSSSLTNSASGSISATSTNQSAYGVYVRNFEKVSATDATISNSGLIHAEATYGSEAKGIYIRNDYTVPLAGTITNNADSGTTTGVISAQADNGKATGIELYTPNVDGLHLTNSGTISATAGSGGNEAYGIQFYGNNGLYINNTTIINSLGAEISATSVNSKAIGIDFSSYNNYLYLDSTSITNAGTISAHSTNDRAYGIRLYGGNGSYMRYVSSITNTGAIEALTGDNSNAYGIFAGKMYDTSHISNSGTITATAGYQGNATGIYVREMRGTSFISNAAGKTISAETGDQGNAQGISVSGMNDSSHISNSGTISALTGSNGTAYGLKIGSMGDSSYIQNSSLISAEAGDNGTAKTIYVQNLSTYITNNGAVTAATALNSNAYGIYIGNMNDSSYFHNNGTITSTADNDGSAIGIYTGNLNIDSSIINASSKTITVEAGDNGNATGIRTGTLYGTSRIINNGTITATAGAYSNARGIDSGYLRDTAYIKNGTSGTLTISGTDAYGIMASIDTSGTIINQGTISVDGTNSAYGMMINNSISGAEITNSGTITATINNQADSAAFSLKTQGLINVYNASTGNLNGNLSVIGGLSNDGTIRLPYNATNAFVTTFVNNGKLQIGLLTDGTLGGTTHSTLNADDAMFNSGSTIDVNVLAASTHADLLIGQTIQDVVTANNSLTINGTLNVTDNSALLNFEYVKDGNTIDLNVVEGTTLLDSAVAGGGNSNTQAVASALQAIQDAGTYPEMDSFFTALNGLSSNEEVARAVESTTPAATNASSSATTQIMNGVQGMVEMRQNTMMGSGGMNSGDINLVDKNLWVKLFGSRGSQDKKDGITGFDVKAHGLGIGADAEVSPRQRIGAALFYTDASVDVNNMPQSSDLKVYTAMLYGNVPVNTNTDFLYQLGYSWQKTESERTILPTYDHAKADFTAKTASLNLKLMQSYSLRNDLSIHPLVETTYRHYTNPSYSETGAGALNLQVDKFTSSQFITGGGAILDYKVDKNSKISTDLRVGYDWHHDAQTVTASYQGAAGVDFTTAGIDNGGWLYDVGIGYETTNVLDGDIEFMYNYQTQGSFQNNVLSAKYTYKF